MRTQDLSPRPSPINEVDGRQRRLDIPLRHPWGRPSFRDEGVTGLQRHSAEGHTRIVDAVLDGHRKDKLGTAGQPQPYLAPMPCICSRVRLVAEARSEWTMAVPCLHKIL